MPDAAKIRGSLTPRSEAPFRGFGSSEEAAHGCSQCHGTGYRTEERGGYNYAVRCDHGHATAVFVPVGLIIEGNPKLKDLLEGGDKQVAAIIAKRRGQANAVTIREIGMALWPEETADPKQFPNIARAIKGTVERLRRLGKMPIAASKVPPYGYFMPATAEETKDAHDRYFHEGIMSIKLSQLFQRDRDLVRELEGQLRIVNSE